MIIRSSSPTELKNADEKEKFNKIIKQSALGLFKNYKGNKIKETRNTKQVMNYLAKNLDGRSFTLLNKHIHELRTEVLNEQNHTLGADSFLVFLDKISNLTPSEPLNNAIISKLSGVDISIITPKSLMQAYETHSIDFKFEEKLRMGQIKHFAANVVPKPRFIFDNYKV